jgi:hypothetical protein
MQAEHSCSARRSSARHFSNEPLRFAHRFVTLDIDVCGC